ncbi:MAG: DegT/DnrJ/EryC1/StrS family aminotransferase [Deltaproteobacteria bacterium]|nr:DegT/DnrJ/EryC1/StrS family aminotransferase [Deltaproteobacteria bacterium]
MRRAFDRVLTSGHYILGPEVEALEKACAEYCGTKHALGVSSGSDALIMALLALNVGPGDEVICPTYSFFATAGAIWRIGAKPVFVDVDPHTFNIDVKAAERAITKKTKALMPVHLFGQCADMNALAKLSLPIIEDAAQAIGAEYDGKRAGSMGAIGCFSFFPSKNLGALGDAGFVTTNDAALHEQLRILRVHGGKSEYHHAVVGGNFRIDALQAALIAVKLPHLDASTKKRQQNAALYTKLLGGLDLELPQAGKNRHIFNQYVIVLKDDRRDALQAFLKERQIATKVYYPVPLHLQACFAPLGGKPGDLPNAEKLAKTSLALPIFPELSDDEIAYVAEGIATFFAR